MGASGKSGSGDGPNFSQSIHLQIAFGSPSSRGDVSQTGRHQHQWRVAVRKRSHDARSSANLPVEPFQRVVGADAPPVFRRHGVITQRLINTGFDDLRSLAQPHLAQLSRHLPNFFLSRLRVFLRMDLA